MQPVQAVGDWGQAILVSITAALMTFLSFIPALLGAAIILLIGWFVAGLLARLVQMALHAVGFERAVTNTGLDTVYEQTGGRWTASRVAAELVKWFVFLIFVQAAANVLGMAQITEIINSIILYIPNVLVALVVLVAGAWLAQFVAELVRNSMANMGVANGGMVASFTRFLVIALAVIIAINQLGIGEVVVNTLYIGLVAAAALAIGLAFGLGGRETAARITESWYEGGRTTARRVAQQADATASDRTATTTDDETRPYDTRAA